MGKRGSAAGWCEARGSEATPLPPTPNVWLAALLVPLCFKSEAHEFEPPRGSDLALDPLKVYSVAVSAPLGTAARSLGECSKHSPLTLCFTSALHGRDAAEMFAGAFNNLALAVITY